MPVPLLPWHVERRPLVLDPPAALERRQIERPAVPGRHAAQAPRDRVERSGAGVVRGAARLALPGDGQTAGGAELDELRLIGGDVGIHSDSSISIIRWVTSRSGGVFAGSET
ncbi:hypothetical protein GCM10010151_73090 [Actinoallomurus spadix]|uniref:Uncharacterized protein n=1 Tax=Actinoallomurus spadix TaxID=79912 RepID=A0ABN0XTM1_9ACTN